MTDQCFKEASEDGVGPLVQLSALMNGPPHARVAWPTSFLRTRIAHPVIPWQSECKHLLRIKAGQAFSED